LNAVLLYDIFHDLEDQNGVLSEVYRVLKPNGILSFSDHRMERSEIISKVTISGLFKLQKENNSTYSFIKN
jgi:ubiquinone/menaquinone biosynthesis C-methylase UbiE